MVFSRPFSDRLNRPVETGQNLLQALSPRSPPPHSNLSVAVLPRVRVLTVLGARPSVTLVQLVCIWGRDVRRPVYTGISWTSDIFVKWKHVNICYCYCFYPVLCPLLQGTNLFPASMKSKVIFFGSHGLHLIFTSYQ